MGNLCTKLWPRGEAAKKKTTYGILGGPRVSGLPFPGSSLQPTGRITTVLSPTGILKKFGDAKWAM